MSDTAAGRAIRPERAIPHALEKGVDRRHAPSHRCR